MLIIVLSLFVSFCLILAYSMLAQRDLIVQEFGERGKLLAKQISIASLDSLLETNYYKLIDIIEANKNETSVNNIQIFDADGNQVASLISDATGKGNAYGSAIPKEVIMKDENEQLVVYYPVIKGLKGMVRLTLSKDSINGRMLRSFLVADAIGLVLLVLATLMCGFAVRRFITAPISVTVSTIRHITEEKDLKKQIQVKSKDEMKVLATCFNDFVSTLAGLFREIKTLVQKTRIISGNLASASEESTAALDEMKANLQSIKEKTNNLDEEMSSSNKAALEVKEFISNVVSLISSLAADIAQSTASIEEMSASIKNISKVTSEKLSLANDLEKSSFSGESEMKNAMSQIGKVSESAHTIMDMIKAINGIAAQTNLLAMNAAIEAAHAGDAGRGFAVVADEIRKLAETASVNSKGIAKSLKQINSYIQASERSTGKAGEYFLSIVAGIKSVADSMMEMNTSTAELAVGSTQIMNSFTSILKTSENVRNSSEEMDEKTVRIAGAIGSLSMLSSEIRNGMEEITVGVNELLKAAGSVLESGNANIDGIAEISVSAGRFSIE